MEVLPALSIPMKAADSAADLIAFTAGASSPLVLFLKPTATDMPLANVRWVWLSVVLAPIAHQDNNSSMYWGTIGSSISHPTGTPNVVMSISNFLAMVMPCSMSYEPFNQGSIIKPFHPPMVRGFSKYVRMTRYITSETSPAKSRSLPAYSKAAFGSWMEHGPTIANKRWSRPFTMSLTMERE